MSSDNEEEDVFTYIPSYTEVEEDNLRVECKRQKELLVTVSDLLKLSVKQIDAVNAYIDTVKNLFGPFKDISTIQLRTIVFYLIVGGIVFGLISAIVAVSVATFLS